MWLLRIWTPLFVFLTFLIGYSVNGISPEFAGMLIAMLSSSSVFVVLMIEHYFKIKDKETE